MGRRRGGVEAAAEESMPAAPRKIALRRRKIALRRGRSMSSKRAALAGAPFAEGAHGRQDDAAKGSRGEVVSTQRLLRRIRTDIPHGDGRSVFSSNSARVTTATVTYTATTLQVRSDSPRTSQVQYSILSCAYQ